MLNLIDALYEYQTLHIRYRSEGMPTDQDEAAEFEGLARILKGQFAGRQARGNLRLTKPISVDYAHQGQFRRGRIRNVTTGGVALQGKALPRPGDPTFLRSYDPHTGVETLFPVRTIWKRGDVVGVAFDGDPIRQPPMWRTQAVA